MKSKKLPYLIVVSLSFLFLGLMPGKAAELIMLEQDGCHWCERWHEEIGDIYPKTDEGKLAPLRQVDIHDAIPEDLNNIRIERFTPSFVLVENGKEIGRIRGYPGDELFWWLLSDLMKQLLPPEDSSASTDAAKI